MIFPNERQNISHRPEMLWHDVFGVELDVEGFFDARDDVHHVERIDEMRGEEVDRRIVGDVLVHRAQHGEQAFFCIYKI